MTQGIASHPKPTSELKELVLFGHKIWQIAFVPAPALAFVACATSGLVLGSRWDLCASIVTYAILAQVHSSAISLAPALLLGESDTYFYVHLVDAEGPLLGQRDGVGFAAASRRFGDRATTLVDISVDDLESREAVWARVGMYTYPDLVGVPVIDANGDPTIADVKLGPLHR